MSRFLKLGITFAIIVSLVAGGGFLFLVVMIGGFQGCGDDEGPETQVQAVANTKAKGWDKQQLGIASQIIGIGAKRGLSEKDIVVALMVAMQESNMRNVTYGDRDSLGVYQQRTSQGWGTPAQIMNPVYAINKFYSAMEGINNRQNMSLLDIALAVQRPSVEAYLSPDHYFPDWEDEARALLAGSDRSKISGGIQNVARQVQVECNTGMAASVPAGNVKPGGWTIPVETYTLTSGYGSRWGTTHYGIDLAASTGTPILAASSGKVISSGPASGFGLWVRIQHANGIITVYGHNNRNVVSVGDTVQTGQKIAEVGSRGQSTGPHLHFEVHKNGTKIDPAPFLQARGITP